MLPVHKAQKPPDFHREAFVNYNAQYFRIARTVTTHARCI
jgi:hypothetical protein